MWEEGAGGTVFCCCCWRVEVEAKGGWLLMVVREAAAHTISKQSMASFIFISLNAHPRERFWIVFLFCCFFGAFLFPKSVPSASAPLLSFLNNKFKKSSHPAFQPQKKTYSCNHLKPLENSQTKLTTATSFTTRR